VLRSILEEAKGAAVEVQQQYAHTISLGVAACPIAAVLAVAVDGSIISIVVFA
jgi:hypothetical protein